MQRQHSVSTTVVNRVTEATGVNVIVGSAGALSVQGWGAGSCVLKPMIGQVQREGECDLSRR